MPRQTLFQRVLRSCLWTTGAGLVLMTLGGSWYLHEVSLQLAAILVALGLAVLGLLALTIWIQCRNLSELLGELRAAAGRFASGDLDQKIPALELVEFDAVAAAMNDMALRLGARIEHIARQEAQHAAMFSSMTEGVLALDLDGRVLSLNETCARLLGVASDRLRGRLFHEVLRKPDLLRLIDAALGDGPPGDREQSIQMNDLCCLHANTTDLYDRRRQKIGALVVLHDVTRLRQLETVRRDFVANVSHELRTPITSIKGFLETLLEGALEDRENAIRFMRIVLRQVNRLNAIIDDLLALSRVQRGAEDRDIPLQSGEIRPVLASAIEMCASKAADKQVCVELDCPAGLAGQINGRLLEQAVVNLIDNAVKYSSAGQRVQVSAADEPQGLRISVRDEGCGIEPKHLPRLFERFYRVDKARSRELGGTGLGLAIVKHIVLAHHGNVGVESRVGQGSCFSIHLPVRVHGLPGEMPKPACAAEAEQAAAGAP